jgi:uncharacterized protein (TIGR03084 family)
LDDILTALAEQHAELGGVLDGLDDDRWRRPTRCEGWDVAAVLLHLAQTDELALGSATDHFDDALDRLAGGLTSGRDVDDGAAQMVEQERDQLPAQVRARWDRGATALRTALGAADPSHRVQWVAGLLSVRTLAATRVAETWIHTGDVADAVGIDLVPAERLRHVARLAWRTLPYAFARAGRELSGPVAFHLTGPSGAAWDFVPDEAAHTVIRGDGVELCLVAARRSLPGETELQGTGPDAEAVLDLVRTYA